MVFSLIRKSVCLVAAGVAVGCGKGAGDAQGTAGPAQATSAAASAAASPAPSGSAALLAQANTAFDAKDWAAAERALRAALAAKPGDPLLLNNLGVVLVLLKRYDEAQAPLNEALAAAETYLVDRKVTGIAAKLASGGLGLLNYGYPVGAHPARQASGAQASSAPAGYETTVPVKRLAEDNLRAIKG